MAWLNATPKPDPASERGKSAAASPVPGISRIDALKKQMIEPDMPPNPAPHITARLIEIGLTEAAGVGAVPLSWGEIVAWQCATCITLQPWESRLIRRLSADYLAEGRRAESENCPAPWHTGPSQRAIETEQARLEAVLG